jgi:3-hydroxybenzoate 6-monooxygenase
MSGVQDEIIIIGGGLGGLTTALALAPSGRRIRLLERASEIAPIGYGIQLGPNVLPLLESLGVGQEVLEASYFPSALVMLDATEGELSRVPFDATFKRQFAGRYLCIHRGDLHEILLGALKHYGNVTLEDSANVTAYSQTESTVSVSIERGVTYRAGALIACDGLNSTLRAKLHPRDTLRQTGYVAHRTVRAMSDVPALIRRDEVTLWVDEGHHIIYYPLRDRSLLNIVAVFKSTMADSALPPAEYKAALQTHLQKSDPEMRAVLDLMDLERCWPIGDREPIRHWAQGRVTLLGDSAHATLQSLAQGAGMAIEDAVTIAALIEDEQGDYPSAFRRFEASRILRTARVQLESRDLWEMYHAAGIARDVRNCTYAQKATQDYYRCFEWLWHPIELRGSNKQARGAAERADHVVTG